MLPLPLGHKADTTLERAIQLINETMTNIDADPGEIAGIGVALAAPVAIGDHMIAIPGVMPGWDGFDIVSPLSATFNTPVYVDNDANYAAYCESRMGAAIGKRDFVYISTNDNVGAGIVAGGEIMHGVTGLAGEIGHIQVDPLGAICSCGNRGCLNTIVAENRLVQLLSVTHGNMTMDDLVAQANNGDPGCRRIMLTRRCASGKWPPTCASASTRRSSWSEANSPWPARCLLNRSMKRCSGCCSPTRSCQSRC